MRRITSNSATLFGVVALMSFWIVYAILGQEGAIEVASSLVLGATAAIAITWLPASVSSIRSGARDGESLLAIGIMFLAAALFFQRAWIIALRWAQRPEWMVGSPVGAFSAWAIFCACALIILAPGTVGGDVPSRNWIYVTVAVAFGALISGITIGAYMVTEAGLTF